MIEQEGNRSLPSLLIRLHVWGSRACFARPEFKVERVSYDVMTPQAARGILEAIHWKPAIRWHIERIHVLQPIAFEDLFAAGCSSEEDPSRGNRRSAIVLVDVGYVIEGRLSLTDRAGVDDNEAKHMRMFTRRALRNKVFHAPTLGMPEFPANFSLLEKSEQLPESRFPASPETVSLGWMLHDIDYEKGKVARFFRAKIKHGVVSVPSIDSPELAA